MIQRVRVRFTKTGKVRFTSHRDVARIWERAVRKAGLAVAYSQGFAPRARLSFGLALSTGYESDAEYLDIDLDEAPDLAGLGARLSAQLPSGMAVTAVAPIAASADSLQQIVTSCTYQIELVPDRYGTGDPTEFGPALRRAFDALCADPVLEIERSRNAKTIREDIKPGVLALELHDAPSGDAVQLRAELSAQPRAVRPADLLTALQMRGAPELVARVRRTHQWIQPEGLRTEPLTADHGRDLGPASGCASADGAQGSVGTSPARPVVAPVVALATREEPNDVRITRGLRPAEPLGGRLA